MLKINRYKQQIGIFLLIFIISFIVVSLSIMFSFNTYASNKYTIDNNVSQTNYIEDSQSDENNSAAFSKEENIEEEQEKEEIIEQPKEVLHTTSSGETYSKIGKLSIPSLNINYDILSSTSKELLNISLNKYWGANPNEVGNMVVVGHNYNNSPSQQNTKFFSKLPNVKIGDIIKITDNNGKTLDYTVYDTDIIDPYDNSCTSQLTDGHTEITLITCYNGGKQRFIAKARAY